MESAAYWLSYQITERRDGCLRISIGGAEGGRMSIEAAPRYNAKRLQQLADTIRGTEHYAKLIAWFQQRNPDVRIVEEEAVCA